MQKKIEATIILHLKERIANIMLYQIGETAKQLLKASQISDLDELEQRVFRIIDNERDSLRKELKESNIYGELILIIMSSLEDAIFKALRNTDEARTITRKTADMLKFLNDKFIAVTYFDGEE